MTASAPVSYAEVVAALLGARTRAATERFDAVVAAAVAAGSLDPELARALRWWQRESVREVVDHVGTVVPATLEALAAAAAQAGEAVGAAERAWRAAGGRDVLAAPADQRADERADDPADPRTDHPPGGRATEPAPTGRPPLSGVERTRPHDPAAPDEPSAAEARRRRLVVAGFTRPAEGAR